MNFNPFSPWHKIVPGGYARVKAHFLSIGIHSYPVSSSWDKQIPSKGQTILGAFYMIRES